LLCVFVVASILGGILWLADNQIQQHFNERLTSLTQAGFNVDEEKKMISFDCSRSTINEIDAVLASQILVVAERYRFQITNCSLSKDASKLFLLMEDKVCDIEFN